MTCMLSTMFEWDVIARSMTVPDSSRVAMCRDVVNLLLMRVRWGSLRHSLYAVSASSRLCIHCPLLHCWALSCMLGSHDLCRALKSPNKNTGGWVDDGGEPGRGCDAMATWSARAMTSTCLACGCRYIPPITTGCASRGDDTHMNAASVRDSAGLYGVQCGI
jgi:hypothetical protein